MKKQIKIISLFCAVGLMVGNVAACGERTSENTLKIGWNTCGYGDEYVHRWAEEYNKAHPDEKIDFKFDNAVGSMQSRLQTSSALSDVFISLSCNWQSWARNGWLEPLDDLYSMSNEDGRVYEEAFRGDYKKYGKLNGVRYVTPHSSVSMSGFVYSHKLFSDNGWEIPETIDDLYALVDKINDLPCNKDKDKTNDIAPFGWGGQTIDYWRDFMLAIWSSMDGREAIEKFYEAESPEIYKDRPGVLRGLEIFRELVCTGEGVPKNSLDGAMGKNYILSQNDFVQGRAAMYICASGIYNETKDIVPDDFDMRVFPFPLPNDAKKDENGNFLRYMVVGMEYFDFMCIPAKATNKELAKKFLLWVSTEKMGQLQLRYSQSISPFQCDNSAVEVNGYTKSILDNMEKTKAEYILGVSDNPLVESGKIRFIPGIDAFTYMILKNYRPKQCLSESYNYAVTEWNNWKEEIGMQ